MADTIEAKNLRDVKKEMMTCTMCGFCKSVCPTFEDIGWDIGVARGRIILAYGLLQKDVPADPSVVDALYQCTTCKDCERRCPSKVKVVDVIERARKDLIEAGTVLPAHKKIVESIRKYGNPYGEPRPVAEVFGEEPRRAKVGYFVGCTSAYRNQSTARATISILKKLGEDYTLLDETCCGSVMGRIGWTEEEVLEQMRKNVRSIAQQGVEEVLFSCAGCYRMFKEEYPKHLEVPFKVRHVSEYLADKDIKLNSLEKKVTYHDPCHLGRHTQVYKAPREVLSKVPGMAFKEMTKNSSEAHCCGGGGGVRSAFPELSAQIAGKRLSEAEFADLLVTTCPFCVNNLRLGKDRTDSKVEVVDLVELIDELL